VFVCVLCVVCVCAGVVCVEGLCVCGFCVTVVSCLLYWLVGAACVFMMCVMCAMCVMCVMCVCLCVGHYTKTRNRLV
jgi:hypothetical protein